ncbi:MAG: chloride channel protein [Roseburia faecis]
MNPSHDLQGLKKKAKETFLYVLSALLLGIAIGAIDAVFGRVLLFITDFRSAHVVVLLPFLPLAGLGIVWLYRHFNETAAKGMTLGMEAGQGKRESIPLALIPLVMAGTWITHLFGGSAGREGVAVQIGATLSHAFARRFHFPDNGRIVLIAGMAAGFGGLFQTPFAAVFFAMEVVVSGSMAYSALLPAAIASFTASATSHALGLEKFSVLLSQTLSLTDTKTVTYLILFGILFGLTGRLFAVLLQKVKQFMGNVLENPYKRIGFVSIPLAVFLFLGWNGRYCGLGTNLIAQAFSGENCICLTGF